MNKLFQRKEPPFVLAILLSAIAWSTSHLVSRAIEQPIVEIQHSVQISNSDFPSCSADLAIEPTESEQHRYTITNLSKNELFRSISFLVRAESGEIFGTRLRPVSPAFPSSRAPTCTAEFANVLGLTLHPGSQFLLEIQSTIGASFDIRLQSASSAIKLMNENFETRLVRYESAIFLVLLVILLAIAIVYLRALAAPTSSEQ